MNESGRRQGTKTSQKRDIHTRWECSQELAGVALGGAGRRVF